MTTSTVINMGQLPEPTANNNNQASPQDQGKPGRFKKLAIYCFQFNLCKIILFALQLLDAIFLVLEVLFHIIPEFQVAFKLHGQFNLALDCLNILYLLWLLLYKEQCRFFSRLRNYIEMVLYIASIITDTFSLWQLVDDTKLFYVILNVLLVTKIFYAGYDLGKVPSRRRLRKKEKALETQKSKIKELEFELNIQKIQHEASVPPQGFSSRRASW